MTAVPAVVDKQPLDINLSGGIDQSQPEEAVDWTKRLIEANNVLVDGDSLRVRPGIRRLFEHGNGSSSPWATGHRGASRIADSGGTLVGVVEGCLYQAQEVAGQYDFLDRNNYIGTYCPAWEVKSRPVEYGVYNGILGVANLTKYKAILTTNYCTGIAATISGVLTIIDQESDAVAARYVIPGGTNIICGMTHSEDRYLYLFAHNYDGVDIPTFITIDTENLPTNLPSFSIGYASSDVTHKWKAVSTTTTGWSAVAGTTGEWYKIVYVRSTATSNEYDITPYFYNGEPTDIHGETIVGWFEDPNMSQFNWTLYNRGSYTASPWAGTASAGISGTRSLAEATNPPGVGSAVNGFTPADFDGTNDRLRDAVNALNTYISDTSGTVVALFKMDALDADDGAASRYNDPQFIGHDATGNFYFGINATGVFLGGWNGAAHDSISSAAVSTGAWHLAVGTWNGTTFYLSIDGAAFTSAARTLSLGGAGGIVMGANYNSTVFLNGQVLVAAAGQFTATMTDVDNIKTFVNNEFGMSF